MNTAHKEALEAELERISAELSSLGIRNPENPSDWIATPESAMDDEADPNVGADRVEEWDERQGVLAELEARYNAIRRALAKIADGTFGTCEICSAVIEPARLEANPAARTCMAHKEDEGTLPQ